MATATSPITNPYGDCVDCGAPATGTAGMDGYCDACGRKHNRAKLHDLFDRVVAIGADLTLWEHETPGAIDALVSWAARHKHPVVDNTYVVENDHPFESWRGMWVSTVRASIVPSTARTRSITVHRSKPADVRARS